RPVSTDNSIRLEVVGGRAIIVFRIGDAVRSEADTIRVVTVEVADSRDPNATRPMRVTASGDTTGILAGNWRTNNRFSNGNLLYLHGASVGSYPDQQHQNNTRGALMYVLDISNLPQISTWSQEFVTFPSHVLDAHWPDIEEVTDLVVIPRRPDTFL